MTNDRVVIVHCMDVEQRIATDHLESDGIYGHGTRSF